MPATLLSLASFKNLQSIQIDLIPRSQDERPRALDPLNIFHMTKELLARQRLDKEETS